MDLAAVLVAWSPSDVKDTRTIMRCHPSLIPLSHDHHQGLTLALRCRKQALGRIKPTGIQGLRDRADEVKGFFLKNLERHLEAEEKILFPMMNSFIPESQALIRDLLEEHREMRAAARKLEGDAGLAKSLFDFGDLLERHIRREDRKLFPLFEKYVTQEEAGRIKSEIETALERRVG